MRARNSNSQDPESTQKVEVVVQSPDIGGEVNILGELAIFTLRVCFSLMMIHHGVEKLNDPGGFAEFVVAKYLWPRVMPRLFTSAVKNPKVLDLFLLVVMMAILF